MPAIEQLSPEDEAVFLANAVKAGLAPQDAADMSVEARAAFFAGLVAGGLVPQDLTKLTDAQRADFQNSVLKGRFTGRKISIASSRLTLPRGVSPRRVMASPPTITESATAQITAGRSLPATTSVDVGNGTQFIRNVSSGDWSFMGAANFQVSGQGPESSKVVFPSTVTQAAPNTMCWWKAGIIHYGNRIEFIIQGKSQDSAAGVKLLFKVNDEYVSLVTTQLNPAGNRYVMLDFAGVNEMRRIEVIGKMYFGGANVDATAIAYPAPVRGPRTIFIGDSFTAATGTTSTGTGPAYPNGYVQCFADAMVWDDVWACGLGGRGYSNSAPFNYRNIVASDVIAYNPELVFSTGGVNDISQGFTQAQIRADALPLFSSLKAALPNSLIYAVSPFHTSGAGTTGASMWALLDTLKQVAIDTGVEFLDITTLPLPVGTVPDTVTTTASRGSGNTLPFNAMPVVGGTYSMVGGSRRFKVLSATAAFVATIDWNINAFVDAGTQFRRVGNSPITGNGNTAAPNGSGNADILFDNTAHPTNLGHEFYGTLIATQFTNLARS